MYGYDIRRFNPDLTRNADWVRQRSHEAYAKNYSIVYPHDEPLASRKMKKSPLHPLLEKAGCVFQERHGWERPGWFSTSGPAAVQPYDWYSAYGHSPNPDQAYVDRLKEDYTFGFPRNHSTASFFTPLKMVFSQFQEIHFFPLSPLHCRLNRSAGQQESAWPFLTCPILGITS